MKKGTGEKEKIEVGSNMINHHDVYTLQTSEYDALHPLYAQFIFRFRMISGSLNSRIIANVL